jgi:hypothetical protein
MLDLKSAQILKEESLLGKGGIARYISLDISALILGHMRQTLTQFPSPTMSNFSFIIFYIISNISLGKHC